MDVLGRGAELAQIDGWLRAGTGQAAAFATPGSVLVIEGEPGIGKTTLWGEAVRRARQAGWQVLSCRPVPSDAGLPHVGLTDLLRPVPAGAFGRLPGPQRRPLEVALLLHEAGEGDLDPRAVGTGLTALLAAVAQGGPLLLAVDDAQWLDPASARSLAFALRRLEQHPVRLAAAVRIEAAAEQRAGVAHGQRAGAFAGIEAAMGAQALSRLPVGPLSLASIYQILRHTLDLSFPRPVLVRIHQAAGGNPFYALEIAQEIRRVGVPPAGRPLPVPANHRDLALLRLRRLPRVTRDALADISAMPSASASDVNLAALAPAERAGIVTVHPEGRVEFGHPLFGSALYSSLPEADRRSLHRRLAQRAGSPEERARHLALAADGPDGATAAELDRAATAASARGAADLAVELKELACRLTPAEDGPAKARRGIELAERRYFAGDPGGARRELEQWLGALPPGEDRARVLLELGSIVTVQGDAVAGPELMMQALGEARTPELRARIHARIAADADDADVAVEHAEAALALLDERDDPQLYSFALHNVALFKLYSGRGADEAAIEKGMRLQREAAAWEMSSVPAMWARNLDDFGTARARFGDLLRVCREQGDEATVSALLTHLARLEAMTGHIGRARGLADEALDLADQTEQGLLITMALCVKAHVCVYAGELVQARALTGQMMRRLADHPDIILEGMARMVLGAAALAAGDLAEADRQLSRSDEIEELMHHREPATNRFQADHAEAVIGLGDLARAEHLVQRLEARAKALPRPWTNAVSARCRGLLNAARGDLDAALADYRRALAAHETLDMPIELGRTLLALGRLHRRRHERQRAQECLARAAATFEACDAPNWAAVTATELGRAQGRRGSHAELTPTERQICELAAAGLRNAEIAARLFLSGKTVEANLSRAYRKLGVRSRTELAGHLAAAAGDPATSNPATSNPATSNPAAKRRVRLLPASPGRVVGQEYMEAPSGCCYTRTTTGGSSGSGIPADGHRRITDDSNRTGNRLRSPFPAPALRSSRPRAWGPPPGCPRPRPVRARRHREAGGAHGGPDRVRRDAAGEPGRGARRGGCDLAPSGRCGRQPHRHRRFLRFGQRVDPRRAGALPGRAGPGQQSGGRQGRRRQARPRATAGGAA
jgi:DNA-binding CsgD family transcriptional regulator